MVFIFCLGVYGDVHRVKILFSKKDNALIQMAEPHQAQLGKYCLLLDEKCIKTGNDSTNDVVVFLHTGEHNGEYWYKVYL